MQWPAFALKGLDRMNGAEPVITVKNAVAVYYFHLNPFAFPDTKFAKKLVRVKGKIAGNFLLFFMGQGYGASSMTAVAAAFTRKDFVVGQFVLFCFHRFVIYPAAVSLYLIGSFMPASLNPLRRSRQESQRPHAVS